MNNQRASALPPRVQVTEDNNKTQDQIVSEAPLLTNPIEQVIPKEETPSPTNVKEWRKGTNMTVEELFYLTEKSSVNIPVELVLRLRLIQENKKYQSLGRRMNKSDLIKEAIDQYTKRELKKLGHEVD